MFRQGDVVRRGGRRGVGGKGPCPRGPGQPRSRQRRAPTGGTPRPGEPDGPRGPQVNRVSPAVEPEPGPVREVPKQAPREPEEEPEPEPAGDFHSLLKAFEEIEEEPQSTPASAPTDADFQSFIESIEPDKEETQVLLQLAELALEGGDARMALLRYEQAIEQDDRNADAWTGKGVSLQQLERYREGLAAYDRALSLQPGHELATKWRATCLRHLESEESE